MNYFSNNETSKLENVGFITRKFYGHRKLRNLLQKHKSKYYCRSPVSHKDYKKYSITLSSKVIILEDNGCVLCISPEKYKIMDKKLAEWGKILVYEVEGFGKVTEIKVMAIPILEELIDKILIYKGAKIFN